MRQKRNVQHVLQDGRDLIQLPTILVYNRIMGLEEMKIEIILITEIKILMWMKKMEIIWVMPMRENGEDASLFLYWDLSLNK